MLLRKNPLVVKLSDEELQKLKDLAKKEQVTVSVIVRARLFPNSRTAYLIDFTKMKEIDIFKELFKKKK